MFSVKLCALGLTGMLAGLVAVPASAVICPNPPGTPCVTSSDIIDGQVGGVDVANNSLTEIDLFVFRRFVVAGAGGDFISVSQALNALTPTAANPVLIDVMPGTYIGNVVMKNFVHLRGAGRDVTILQSSSPATNAVSFTNINNSTISGFTIRGGMRGISNTMSSPTITGNTIRDNMFGIHNETSSAPLISGNIIAINGEGIRDISSVSQITDNIISSNPRGILELSSLSTIANNTIGGYTEGIRNTNSSPQILHNQIFDTGASSVDIIVESGAPNISFNVFDSITGATGAGVFNANSSGGAVAVP